jgi:hypothetical protein
MVSNGDCIYDPCSACSSEDENDCATCGVDCTSYSVTSGERPCKTTTRLNYIFKLLLLLFFQLL